MSTFCYLCVHYFRTLRKIFWIPLSVALSVLSWGSPRTSRLWRRINDVFRDVSSCNRLESLVKSWTPSCPARFGQGGFEGTNLRISCVTHKSARNWGVVTSKFLGRTSKKNRVEGLLSWCVYRETSSHDITFITRRNSSLSVLAIWFFHRSKRYQTN